jgi:hypothetical protein
MRNLQSEKEKISVHDYFFPKNNPSIQRYYRFTISPHAPFGALHKRPGSSDALSVTGLLHRSAVLASHGTDPTGDWVLLSVGGEVDGQGNDDLLLPADSSLHDSFKCRRVGRVTMSSFAVEE